MFKGMASVPVAATIATSRHEASHLNILQRRVTCDELVTTRPESYTSVKRIANEIDQVLRKLDNLAGRSINRINRVKDKLSDDKSATIFEHDIDNHDGPTVKCPVIPERGIASLENIEQLLDVELTRWTAILRAVNHRPG